MDRPYKLNHNNLLSKITFCISLVCIFSHHVRSQNQLSFDNETLDQVLMLLEVKSDYSFNYDPTLLKAFTYTGSLSSDITQNELQKLLYNTPYDFDLNNKTVLIFTPDPARYKICGMIKDGLTNESLAFANISADGSSDGSQTMLNGYFEFDLIAHKNQTISISYIGYETKKISLQELSLDPCPTIYLHTDSQLWTNEIIITDYVLDGITEGEAYNGYSMDYSQLSRNHSAVEHDVLKTIQLIPGIVSTDESATHLMIRGSTESQNLLLWEGAPLYQSGHLFGMISAINPFAVDKINIYKGSYDPRYDNRVGGVIDISMTDSINQSTSGSVGITLTEAHFNVDLPLTKDKLAIILSGRHSTSPIMRTTPTNHYIDRVLQYSIIDDQSLDVTEGSLNGEQDLAFHDWKTKFLYKPHPRLFIKASLFQNSQAFEYSYSFQDDPFISADRIDERAVAINTSMTWKTTNKWSPTVSILHSAYRNSYNLNEEELNVNLRDYDEFNEIYDRTYSFSNAMNLSKDWSVQGGYDYNIKRVDFTRRVAYFTNS